MVRFVDSDTCIRFLRGSHPGSIARWRAQEAGQLRIPLPVYGELLVGAEKSIDRSRAFGQIEQLLRRHALVEMTAKTARHYAAIRAKLEREGKIIGSNDLWIAASAVAHGATVVTSNTREFSRVEGLTLEDWTLPPSPQRQ